MDFGLDYRVVEPGSGDGVEYPRILDELRDVGFAEIGRVVAEPVGETFEDLASIYEPADGETFLAHARQPTPVFRSPDHQTWVDVSWFWESPSVRFWSEMEDGSLVQTMRRWDVAPPQGFRLQPYRDNLDIDEEMCKSSVPDRGRSIVVATRDIEGLWKLHQQHCALCAEIRETQPASLFELDDLLGLWRAALRHDMRTARRLRAVVIAAWSISVLTLTAASCVAILNPGWLLIATPIALIIALRRLEKWVMSGIRYVPRWLRPRYR